MLPRWQRPSRACAPRRRLRPCKRPWRPRRGLRGRAIPCCCLRPAPASICGATTAIAATCLPTRSASSSGGPHDHGDHVLWNAGARTDALRLGLHHSGVGGQPVVGGPDHGHFRVHVDRRARSRQSVLLSRAAIHLRRRGGAVRLGADARADGALGQIQSRAAVLGPAALVVGADSRYRSDGERRAALAADRADQFPGLGACQGPGADLGVQLLRAQAQRARTNPARTCQAGGAAERRRAAAAARTRFWRSHGVVRHRLCRPVRRRRPLEVRAASGLGGGAGVRDAGAHLGLSSQAPDRIFASLGRSLQRRLSVDAVADRHWPRRLVRRRSRQQRAEIVLFTRGAHRLRVRRARRGAGAGRRARGDHALHGAGVARPSDITHGGPNRHEDPILPGAGFRRLAGTAGQREHRRQHGCAADQGPDPAAIELRPKQPAGEPRVARRGAEDLSRGQVQLALRRDAHTGGCPMSGGPVLIMAGGTGGHEFPALAVAKGLRDRGVAVVWLGVPGSMESRLVPANGFPIEWVRVAGIRGKGIKAWLLAPVAIFKAVAQALSVLRRVRPRSVLGAGGYVSGPGGIAAWLLRVPLLIHEQNAVAGMTNRWLARLATQVLEAFPGSFGPEVHARAIGNPVRADIAALPAPPARFAGRESRSRLLVFGGSQGALRLNAVVPQALARVAPEIRPQVRHQAGERGLEAARAAYADARVEADLLPFIDDMAEALSWADLAVCRAGAMTIAELQAAGLGAIFVPLAVATDDHQTKNAEVMVGSGAARLIQERDLTP